MGRTDYDVTKSRLQNQRYFREIYFQFCNCKTKFCGVAKKYLEITLTLQPALSDDKISPARAREKRLFIDWSNSTNFVFILLQFLREKGCL